MSVAIVARSFQGGAGRAAQRLYRGFADYADEIRVNAVIHDSRDTELESHSPVPDEPGVLLFEPPIWRRSVIESANKVAKILIGGPSRQALSPAIIPTGLPRVIEKINPSVLNFHWLSYDMLSLSEIRRFALPSVWTLHDEWFFSGANHYQHELDARHSHLTPFGKINKALDTYLSSYKKRAWKSSFDLVAPSRWMASRAAEQIGDDGHRIHVIPNALDTDYWKPLDLRTSARTLGLDPAKTYIVSGAASFSSDPRKGGDLLREVMRGVRQSENPSSQVTLLVFGARQGDAQFDIPGVVNLGQLSDPQLRAVYSLASINLVTSRLDNLPQTVTEAAACGTPSVAFNVGGLADTLVDGRSGFLVRPYAVTEMAKVLLALLGNPDLLARAGSAARKRATLLWQPSLVCSKYREVFYEANCRFGTH